MKITEKQYEIHYYEIDYKQRALITSIVDYLGDIATYQGEELGVGMEYLERQNLGWVLYKWNIEMEEYPLYGEKIIIKTWPYSLRKFYAYRQFEIFNEAGKKIGRADSIWFLINLEKRRPIRINEELYEAYGIDLKEDKIIEIKKIEKIETPSYIRDFEVRYSDIDTNHHVNNTKYIAWCLETIPFDIIKTYTLKEIQVIYEKEVRYGEIVHVKTEIIREGTMLVGLHRIEDIEGKELTLVKTSWRADT